ncbi:MAG: site-2 protease family protein [Pirellulales bacterium]
MIWLKLIAAIAVGSVAFTLTGVIVAKLLSVYVTDVVIFFGPKLIRMRLGTVTYSIGIIPTGGSVEFEPGALESMPLWKTLTFAIVGLISLLLMSVAFVGPTAALASFISGFHQLLTPLFSFEEPRTVISQLVTFLSSASLPTIFGFTAAKQAAANVIPFPTSPFGGAIANTLKRNVSDQAEAHLPASWDARILDSLHRMDCRGRQPCALDVSSGDH